MCKKEYLNGIMEPLQVVSLCWLRVPLGFQRTAPAASWRKLLILPSLIEYLQQEMVSLEFRVTVGCSPGKGLFQTLILRQELPWGASSPRNLQGHPSLALGTCTWCSTWEGTMRMSRFIHRTLSCSLLGFETTQSLEETLFLKAITLGIIFFLHGCIFHSRLCAPWFLPEQEAGTLWLTLYLLFLPKSKYSCRSSWGEKIGFWVRDRELEISQCCMCHCPYFPLSRTKSN